MKKHSIEAHLAQARMLIENGMNHPKVSKKLAEYGYTRQRLKDGKVLLEQIQLYQTQKEECYSHKKALKKQLAEDIKTLKALYAEHLTIARFAFRHDVYMQAHLQLKGTRKTDRAGWISQIHKFYTRIEKEVLETMKQFGALEEELLQGKAMIEAIIAARHRQASFSGDAQLATQKRNELLKALDVWVSRFKKVARGALQEEDQLLETLGIVVAG